MASPRRTNSPFNNNNNNKNGYSSISTSTLETRHESLDCCSSDVNGNNINEHAPITGCYGDNMNRINGNVEGAIRHQSQHQNQNLPKTKSKSNSNSKSHRRRKNSTCSYTSIPTDDDQRFVNHNPSQPLIKKEDDKIEVWPFILINISLALVNCSSRFHGPVMDQYVYQESARKILGRADIVTTSDPCLPANASSHLNSTLASLVLKAQDLASNTLLHLDLTSYGVGIFSNSLLGAYSGVLNRKLLLFIPTFGYFIRNVTIPTVIFWKLDLHWLFVGYAVDGLCGNASGIYFGSYLYTTDITSRSGKRTVGVAILQSLKGLVTASLNIATGHLIQRTGVLVPSLISASFVLGSIVTILFLPNRQPYISRGEGVSRWSLSAAFKSYLIPFRSHNERGKSAVLVLGYLSFLGVLICHFGITKIRNLFLMDLPFCWSSSRIGWFLFGREMAIRLFVLFIVPCCHRRIPGVLLAIFGTLSYIGGQIVYTMANTSFQVLFAPLAAVGQSLPSVMVRGELSRMFEPELQGPLFAGFAVAESVSFATGALFLQIYSASLSFFPRMVFVVSSGISLIVLVFLIYFQVLWKRIVSAHVTQETSIQAPSNGSINHSDCPERRHNDS